MNRYGPIPKKILNQILGEDYFIGPYTLQQELDRYPNDVIEAAKYSLVKGKLDIFHAWSKDHVFMMYPGLLEDKYIVAVPRNPPKKKKK